MLLDGLFEKGPTELHTMTAQRTFDQFIDNVYLQGDQFIDKVYLQGDKYIMFGPKLPRRPAESSGYNDDWR